MWRTGRWRRRKPVTPVRSPTLRQRSSPRKNGLPRSRTEMRAPAIARTSTLNVEPPVLLSCGAMGPAIELNGVSVRRGETWILRDVDWVVPAGACAAILGPNGSGKSTLTRVLACHLWPTTGAVRVAGGAFGDASLPELRRHIRLVQPAGPYDVDPQLTAHEAVLTGFFGSIGLYEEVTDDMHRRADELLAHVGLS